MNHCSEHLPLHDNVLGQVGYCYGCDSYHLRMNGLLSVVSFEQLNKIEHNLKNIKADLETDKDANDPKGGVEIKIATNTYLCLSYADVLNGLELISMGKHMKNVNDFILR